MDYEVDRPFSWAKQFYGQWRVSRRAGANGRDVIFQHDDKELCEIVCAAVNQWRRKMDVRDIFYHGIHQQVRRVLNKMTDDQIDKGLTAFEDGASNWSHCFFARALEMDKNYIDSKRPAEFWVMDQLGLESIIPVRIVYGLFDGVGKKISFTRDKLKEFISNVRDERRPEEVLALLQSLDQDTWTNIENTSVEMSCVK